MAIASAPGKAHREGLTIFQVMELFPDRTGGDRLVRVGCLA